MIICHLFGEMPPPVAMHIVCHLKKLYGIGDYLGSNTEGIESYRNTKNYNIQKDVYNSSVSHNT